jgi:peroxiredoxin
MALTETPRPDTDFIAPGFTLSDPHGHQYSLDDIRGAQGTVIAFICNHCPYVKAIIDRLVADLHTLQNEGFGVAAIMPNDYDSHPDDAPEKMAEFSKTHGFAFPYLIDGTQNVARAFGAVCTPDIFGFDAQDLLHYRGRLDSAGAQKGDDTGTQDTLDHELLKAMRQIATTGTGPKQQYPAMGCSIKWRA